MTSEAPPAPAPAARRNVALIVVLAVVAGLILLTVGGVLVATLARAEIHTDETVQAGDRVEIDIPVGEIVVVAADRTDIGIRVDGDYLIRVPDVTADTDDGVTRITGGCPSLPFSICSVIVRIELPADVDLDVSGVNGRVSVDGVTGQIEVTTTNGGIEIADPAARLDLATVNGSVTVTGASSTEVGVATVNGAVRLGFDGSPTWVDARATNGSIEIGVPDDEERYAIDAETVNGSIELVRVVNDPDADRAITAHTVNGAVTVSAG